MIGRGGWVRSNSLSVQSRVHHQLCYSRILVSEAGFDPAISCFQGRRITRLSHSLMERTGGFEPPFSTPITVHRFVAGVGYVRMAPLPGFDPGSPA